MDRWVGKVAVVTGASAGIGASTCVALANAGLTVVGLARRAELVDRLKEKITGSGAIHSKRCDVSKYEDVVGAFAWVEQALGGTDVLVNNAGVLIPGHITDVGDSKIDDASILSVIDTNFKGLVMCTRQAVASMKIRNFDGHIININSLAGHYVPFDSCFNVYSGTKHAVTAFSAALLNELADCHSRIKVTSISPGKVRTSMSRDTERGLEPADIADCIVYALSTPPNVNIYELGVCSVAEKKL
ncbi:farnesol dehydrogenase-like [Aricia agestis]|uniref:farnesol dehydrogenase-like n=1 Tax=Aricia agestis TaxID=91739 RepID=UPI001C201746|nr:farnesol dehydrogenase-like [Aricia agestis]XP_041971714.1 farnesol dehydrogenase-like [Aricia agestis]